MNLPEPVIATEADYGLDWALRLLALSHDMVAFPWPTTWELDVPQVIGPAYVESTSDGTED